MDFSSSPPVAYLQGGCESSLKCLRSQRSLCRRAELSCTCMECSRRAGELILLLAAGSVVGPPATVMMLQRLQLLLLPCWCCSALGLLAPAARRCTVTPAPTSGVASQRKGLCSPHILQCRPAPASHIRMRERQPLEPLTLCNLLTEGRLPRSLRTAGALCHLCTELQQPGSL